MAVPVWPAELPRPMRQGYGRADGEGRTRSRADAGPVRMRRRSSAVPQPLAMVFDFSVDELARFDRFFAEETAEGTLPFIMTDWTTDGHGLMTADGEALTDEAGNALVITARWLCQFGERLPERSVVGVRRRVQVTIEVLP